jgi:hypothetical protein
MSDIGFAPVAEQASLTQWQRVANTFTAPSKTFEDIKHGNQTWWLPFVLMIVISYIFFAAVSYQIGWAQVATNTAQMNPKSQQRMAQLSADQREMSMRVSQYAIEGSVAASPLLILIVGAIVSGVMLGTINFLFGGKATFPALFSVWMFASLPTLIKTLLGLIVLFAGMAPESFNLANYAPTNLGAFLSPQDVNAGLYRLASAIDLTTIWYLILFSMGVATVAGVKKSSGYIAVFGWWGIIVVLSAGTAAIFG